MTSDDVHRLVRMRAAVQSGAARQQREASGLTCSEVAAAVGCSTAAVRSWELGRRVPQGDLALRYAALLDSL